MVKRDDEGNLIINIQPEDFALSGDSVIIQSLDGEPIDYKTSLAISARILSNQEKVQKLEEVEA